MTIEHLIEAIRVTAHHYAGNPDAQMIVEVLRGIVARAQRYEAQESVESKAEVEVLRAALLRECESDSVVASCNCHAKSPEIQYHKPGCKYRIIVERNNALTRIAELEVDGRRLDWLEAYPFATQHFQHFGLTRFHAGINKWVYKEGDTLRSALTAVMDKSEG